MYWGVVYFWIFSHFHGFWRQSGVLILLTPKQDVVWKSIKGFCVVRFFASVLSRVRKQCSNKKSLYLSWLFCLRASIWTSVWCFSNFLKYGLCLCTVFVWPFYCITFFDFISLVIFSRLTCKISYRKRGCKISYQAQMGERLMLHSITPEVVGSKPSGRTSNHWNLIFAPIETYLSRLQPPLN